MQSVTGFVASYKGNKFRCDIHTYTYRSVADLKICYSENKKYTRKKEARLFAETANCVVIFTTNGFLQKYFFVCFTKSINSEQRHLRYRKNYNCNRIQSAKIQNNNYKLCVCVCVCHSFKIINLLSVENPFRSGLKKI